MSDVRTVTARGPRAAVSWGPRSPLALMAGLMFLASNVIFELSFAKS